MKEHDDSFRTLLEEERNDIDEKNSYPKLQRWNR